MPKVTVHSPVYPSVKFAGIREMHIGETYGITVAEMQAMKQQFAGYQPGVQANIQLTFADDVIDAVVVTPATAAAVVNPPLPPAPLETDIPPDEEELVDPPEVVTELSEEDDELVDIEVKKLIGKPVEESEPVLIATGGNPDLPKLLRQVYLQRVIDHHHIKQALKDAAQRLQEQIA